MSVFLNQSSLTDLFNSFVCNQGIRNIAKETEDKVKRHGVKGVKAWKDQIEKKTEAKILGVKVSKDDGIKDSFVEEKRSKVSTGVDARIPSCQALSVNEFLSYLRDFLSRALGVFLCVS